MIQLKMGQRGEIVIPKKIREHLGLSRDRPIILTVKDKKIELSTPERDIIKEMEDFAKKYGTDTSNWKMGDELYEEVFSDLY